MPDKYSFKPLTADTWEAFEQLLGPRGACGGCWCMTWRLHKADFDKGKSGGNKKAIQKLARKNEPIGMIAFAGNEPAGWCAIAPREKYIRLEKSRALKPVDDQPVWSVSCFFIAKAHRRKGLSVTLLKAAVQFAKDQGAEIIEAYPVEPKDKKMPDVFAWTGIVTTYTKAGFVEVARHTVRPILRYTC